MQIYSRILILIAALSLLGGCASKLREDTYTRGQARQAQVVQFGTVEHVRTVKIEGTKSGVGSTAGGALGAIGGAGVGSGRTALLVGGVVGSVAGGLAGAAIEEGVTRQDGVEVTVKLDDGTMVAVVQEVQENISFAVGDRVRLMQGSIGARVTK